MDNRAIAQTILQQLGGGRFIAMTGCRDFVARQDSALSFRLPRKTNRITHVQIALTPMDTYTMDFMCWNSRSLELEPRMSYDGVYCDQLARIFTEATGLHTRL